jgi:hypothetical protein
MSRLRHIIANALLILAEDVNAKITALANPWPTRRQLPRTKRHHGRVQRQRDKGLRSKPDGFPLQQPSDNDDACGEISHGLSKGSLIEHCGLLTH